jgi:hypothetical protein
MQPSTVMNYVLFMCVSCRSNQVKTVKEWPTDILENTPGLSEYVSSVAAVLTTDCPARTCNVRQFTEEVSIGYFSWYFGAVVKAVAETFELSAFVPLYKYKDDGVEGFEDCNEASFRCFVPVFSKEEVDSTFQVERVCCTFRGQGGKFVPHIYA